MRSPVLTCTCCAYCLRACYAMSGTGTCLLRYQPTTAMRCPVLSFRIVLSGATPPREKVRGRSTGTGIAYRAGVLCAMSGTDIAYRAAIAGTDIAYGTALSGTDTAYGTGRAMRCGWQLGG
eukprot:3717131-Rhodomonas_salina.1